MSMLTGDSCLVTNPFCHLEIHLGCQTGYDIYSFTNGKLCCLILIVLDRCSFVLPFVVKKQRAW